MITISDPDEGELLRPCLDMDEWREAISTGRLADRRPEDIVRAIQSLGAAGDKTLLHPLAKHLSDLMTRMLRARIGRHHPDEGVPIIERVHSKLWEAILRPESADGKGLGIAFRARMNFRLKDAIAAEYRTLEAQDQAERQGPPRPRVQDEQSLHAFTPSIGSDSELADVMLALEEALAAVPDPRKRQAFRLHMDGLPCHSKRSHSIAKVMGVNEQTARIWVSEVQAHLKKTFGVLS